MNYLGDISYFFFEEIRRKRRLEIKFEGNKAFIIPRDIDEYYKPTIIVNNMLGFSDVLYDYLDAVNNFYKDNTKIQEKHDISYFLNNLLSNLTNSDAMDLGGYIKKRTIFFRDKSLISFEESHLLFSDNNCRIYGKKEMSSLGFESPYVFSFTMNINNKIYNLPLIRYAIDEDDTCYLFAVQFDRHAEDTGHDENYKKVVNSVNKGIRKYRNVQPSFVLVLNLFLKVLESEGINKIMAPDYFFSRYKRYYNANTIKKSNILLERILNNYILLLQRMEYQLPNFEIVNYPNEIDSYTHIRVNNVEKVKRII